MAVVLRANLGFSGKRVMAEFLWAYRYRAAPAALLVGAALLPLLDYLTRPDGSDATLSLVVAIALAVASLVALVIPWEREGLLVRLIPAATVLVATLVATVAGDASSYDAVSSDGVAVGLTIVAVLTLAYVGFATTPLMPLVVSPIVLVVVLVAGRQGSSEISLAVPLVAVPLTAIIAEVVAVLADRANAADDQGRERLERLSQLEAVLRRFRQPGSLEQAAEQVAAAALEIFDVERSTVVLRDSTGNLISVSLGPVNDGEPDPATADLVARTISSDEARLMSSGTNGMMLVLPLPAAEAPAGAVLVHPIRDEDPEFTLDLARLFAVQVGVALEHLLVIDELAKASTLDALTGIGNRRHADTLLGSLQPGDALVVLDLDHLKTVNDTMGHAAGDQVLQELSNHLRECLRDSDTSARLGGDEFLIVARRAHADPLAVADRVLDGWVGKGGLTTLSAGVALHDPDATSSETFERADRALYQAKKAGKDQARLWQSPVDA